MSGPSQHNPFDDPALAAAYDGWFETPMGRVVDRLEKALIYRLAQPKAGETALDVGTGTGHFARDLAAQGLRVTGYDSSEAMLQVARAADARVAWERGDAEGLPFPDGFFDLVLSVTALEFLRDPVQALAEMARVTARGGRLVVAALNARSPWGAARLREAREQETPFRHARFYIPEEFVRALGRHGSVEWSSSVFFGPTGRGMSAAGLLERLGQAVSCGRGALLVGRVAR
jgi:ubiquinone/menaquinone biosynthesis C-methylase UbiE